MIEVKIGAAEIDCRAIGAEAEEPIVTTSSRFRADHSISHNALASGLALISGANALRLIARS